MSQPTTDCIQEVPGHIAAKQHAPYDEKPAVQLANEQLTDETPTGYKHHSFCDKTSGDGLDAGDWTAAGQDADGFPVEKDSAEDVTPVNAEGVSGVTNEG
jgi:hypothetical protein